MSEEDQDRFEDRKSTKKLTKSISTQIKMSEFLRKLGERKDSETVPLCPQSSNEPSPKTVILLQSGSSKFSVTRCIFAHLHVMKYSTGRDL
jgi:hypothetical protein